MTAAIDHEQELIDEIAQFDKDPRGFKAYAYPWGEAGSELERHKGTRAWQDEVDGIIGDHLQNPQTRFQPLLIAVASGHGIGKSAEIGQLVHWAMSTCQDCKVIYTANTETQLRTKTTPEIHKWFRLGINSHWFERTATAIYAKDPKHEKSWRADAVTWSVNNTEAFAGLHNEGKRIIVIFDEGSAIHDKVWEVTEGALTDENTEIIWIVFGNFTRSTGRFADCFKRFRHRWVNRQIDSRTVEGTNKAQIQKWIDDYGEDSDFVKVRVRGMPPSASGKQFISTNDVDAAFGKHLRPEQYSFAPKIITVDPAWEGDDELVIAMRQGLSFKVLKVLPKNDNDMQVGAIVARFEDEERADAVFVDIGWGTGIISYGKTLGRDWVAVGFADASPDPGCLNMRAYIWKQTRDWLKSGGAIPPDQTLYQDLIGPETVARIDGKIQLESKKDMKERGLPSPNRADSLALSFAHHVNPKITHVVAQSGPPPNHRADYKPY